MKYKVYHTQDVPEISTENWRMSTIAQSNENALYKYGPINASVMNKSHSNVFWQQQDQNLVTKAMYARDIFEGNCSLDWMM
jgi:hypothetical protein